MSLKKAFPVEIPSTTREIVEVILAKDSVCRLLGEEGEKLVDEEQLSEMYAR